MKMYLCKLLSSYKIPLFSYFFLISIYPDIPSDNHLSDFFSITDYFTLFWKFTYTEL